LVDETSRNGEAIIETAVLARDQEELGRCHIDDGYAHVHAMCIEAFLDTALSPMYYRNRCNIVIVFISVPLLYA
jgi:hypothetical protein